MSSLEVPLDKSFKCVASPSVTGADLAEELFESILWYALQQFYSFGLLDIPSKEQVVRDVASLSLVSKYFASICRPCLYNRITLRTNAQLKRLMSLLNNGCHPLGRHPLAFTRSLEIQGEEADVDWINQIATGLFPRLTRTGASDFPSTRLIMHTAFGLEPGRDQLRPLPSSFFQHITHLEFKGPSFNRTEDLLRCLSFFRKLFDVHLEACSCSTVSAPAASLRFPLSTTLYSVDMDDERYFSAILPALLDVYVRRHARRLTFIRHDQEELRSLVDMILLLYDNLSPAEWKNNTNVDLAHNFAVDVEKNSSPDLFQTPESGVLFLRFASTRRQYILSICAYPMPEKSDRDALWREFASYVIRLRHLNTLRFEFEHLSELKDYVMTMNPILRSISRAGKAMVFNVYGEKEWAQWELETSDRMARRFFYAHEVPPERATMTEHDEEEKFNMMISFSGGPNPGIAFPAHYIDLAETEEHTPTVVVH